MTVPSNYRANLRKLISDSFSLEEVRTVCYDAGIDFENLGGEGKEAKIREMLLSAQRLGRFPDLLSTLQTSRPLTDWQNTFVQDISQGNAAEDLEGLLGKAAVFQLNGQITKAYQYYKIVQAVRPDDLRVRMALDQIEREYKLGLMRPDGSLDEAKAFANLHRPIELHADLPKSTDPTKSQLPRTALLLVVIAALVAAIALGLYLLTR